MLGDQSCSPRSVKSGRPVGPGFPSAGEGLWGCVISFARLFWTESAISFAGEVPVSMGESAAGGGGGGGQLAAGVPSTSGPAPRPNIRKAGVARPLRRNSRSSASVGVPLQGESGCCRGNKAGGPASGLWTSLGSVPGRGCEPREWHKSRGLAWGGSCVHFHKERIQRSAVSHVSLGSNAAQSPCVGFLGPPRLGGGRVP